MDILKKWIPFALLGTVALFLTYVSVQQEFRQSANDPQIQIAEDAARELAGDTIPSTLKSSPVSIELSLAPYTILFDGRGAPIVGTGYLHGSLPTLPSGVFDIARTKGEIRFTWQPETGVRSAVVIRSFETNKKAPGFILAGRSLREIEKRETQLRNAVLLGWTGYLSLSFLLACFL